MTRGFESAAPTAAKESITGPIQCKMAMQQQIARRIELSRTVMPSWSWVPTRTAPAVAAVLIAALAAAAPASAALWLSMDKAKVRPGQVVGARAVTPCSGCPSSDIYLAPARVSALRRVARPPDRPFIRVGRFDWRRGSRFSFVVPRVRPGTYQLVSFCDPCLAGPAGLLVPSSTMLYVRRSTSALRIEDRAGGSRHLRLAHAYLRLRDRPARLGTVTQAVSTLRAVVESSPTAVS